jgi:hypothetical protein
VPSLKKPRCEIYIQKSLDEVYWVINNIITINRYHLINAIFILLCMICFHLLFHWSTLMFLDFS